ncbi:hypothetical protein [Nocardia sp. NPDC019395]|uniref:hypothetical protein n=1 Tax=Nocardia sp. NPDC019395 TaxID=3154686 RepID=UPI0033E97A0C
MSSPALTVAVLGAGLLGDRIADRIGARPGLELAARIPDSPTPPAGTTCVVYVPSFTEITAGAPEAVLPQLLRAGYDVISTAPFDGDVPAPELHEACTAGDSTFHATGAFQATIPARLIRSLTEVTRGIRRVELVEELDLTGTGVYPWGAVGETGIGAADTAAAAACAGAVDGYYTAGLRVLDEVAFAGTAGDAAVPSRTVDVVTGDDGTVEKVIVERELGPSLSYRSIWKAATTDRAPLRYRLTTTTDSAKGTANVRFRCTEGLHPADHLTCVNVVEAIGPVRTRAAGISHRDLSITGLVAGDRLSG